MAKECRWKMRSAGDQTWLVHASERVNGQRAGLVELHKMAHRGNVESPGTYARLRGLRADVVASPAVVREARRRAEELVSGAEFDLYSWINAATLTNISVPPDALEAEARRTTKELLTGFPEGALYLVRQDTALHYRIAAMRILLMAEEDELSLTESPDPSNFKGFSIARGIARDYLYGLHAYLTPAMLAESPYVWAFPAPRIGGVLIYTLGDCVQGRETEQRDILHHFSPARDMSTPHRRPVLASSTYHDTLTWWVGQLDKLFAEATDPMHALRTDGTYDARMALGTFLSLEQVFRNVEALLVHESDSHTRRMLCFDTLDTLEGLRLLDFDSMCELRHARKAIEEIERSMPANIGALLLPRARRAADALQDLQNGFVLKARLRDGGLRLPAKRGPEVVVSLEKASAFYLRMLRNAGHGFNGKQDIRYARDEALLGSHTGALPYNLADLAYLYVLRLVCNPTLLRSPIQRQRDAGR